MEDKDFYNAIFTLKKDGELHSAFVSKEIAKRLLSEGFAVGVPDSIGNGYTLKVTERGKNFTIEMNSPTTETRPKVFIVHGHDHKTKNEVADYIRSIGFVPIILHEQANRGRTIIEKFEGETIDVSFAIILYTPCDMGKKKRAKKYKPRARQNVVFEHGFFEAKLGREKVLPLYKNGVELPGDILGVVYTPMDNKGEWKNEIIREMAASKLITQGRYEFLLNQNQNPVHSKEKIEFLTDEEIEKIWDETPWDKDDND